MSSIALKQRRASAFTPSAFTMVELLVVLGIIVVLISILIPAISRVRQKAYEADTNQYMSQLQAAIENYQQEFRAYPGPIQDDMIHNSNLTTGTIAFTSVNTGSFDQNWNPAKITGTENLALGLLGGLVWRTTTNKIEYDPSQVGLGPSSLNPANPKRLNPYLPDSSNLSWRTVGGLKTGRFIDGAGFADDSIIPEFVDRFPDPMPILYLRAKRGVPTITTALSATNNSVVTYDIASDQSARLGTYDLHQIIAYTGAYTGDQTAPAIDTNVPPDPAAQSIGVGKRAPAYISGGANIGRSGSFYHGLRTVNPTASLNKVDPTTGTISAFYSNPLDAFPYIQNPSIPNSARNKDSYILISAGVDRIYGTTDDVVSFGSVGQ